MRKKNIVVFAKEKYGLSDSIDFLKNNFGRVDVFKGKLGDPFPAEVYNQDYDICISYMSPWIISKKLLSRIKEFSINFHPGPPEYRGIGCVNFALYNKESTYGVTAHLMIPQVDSGPIIGVQNFPIAHNDSLVSVTHKCYQYISKLFFKIFNYYLKSGRLPTSDRKWSKHLYTRKELNHLCKIKIGMSKNEIERRIKATNFPKMPKAYIQLFGYHFEYKE